MTGKDSLSKLQKLLQAYIFNIKGKNYETTQVIILFLAGSVLDILWGKNPQWNKYWKVLCS